MSINIPGHLENQIKAGKVVIVTGAGASRTSQTRAKKPIKLSEELAAEIAASAGFPHQGESLADVIDATRDVLGDSELKAILEKNYLDCTPSSELADLFSFSWRRVYTFNIDDSIRHIPKRNRAQRLRYFNALKDRREDPQGYSECQVIHLHGFVSDYSTGLIFSASDYAKRASSRLPWYERLGEDFHDYTVIFVGSKLDEPLLFQHVNAVLKEHETTGQSYLVTPSAPSPIMIKSLEKKNIFHISGSLEGLTRGLSSRFPLGLKPSSIVSTDLAGDIDNLDRFTAKDVEALRSLYPITQAHIEKRAALSNTEQLRAVRRYYEGYGPSWSIILHRKFAKLKQFDPIFDSFITAINSNRSFILLGESGSGKSTCCMHIALKYAEAQKSVPIFEYRDSIISLKAVLLALRKYVDGAKCVLLIENPHIFADELSEILSDSVYSFVNILSSARLGEWQSRLISDFPRAHTATLMRFSDADLEEIVHKVRENVAAPAFTRLTIEEQKTRLQKSKKQILIALKEATESRGFDDIIEDEFSRIDDKSAKMLFYIIALATIARAGLLSSSAESIFRRVTTNASYSDILRTHLVGMIDLAQSGRLQARHEIYARHVINHIAGFDDLVVALTSILDYFSTFEMPVIRNISQLDGQVFKYILNNRYIYELCESKQRLADAATIYEAFALKLQLDGHFWL